MASHLDLLNKANIRKGADDNAIHEVEQQIGFSLPEAYVAFLRVTDGYEGPVGEAYARMWGCAELIQANKDYEFSSFAPGYFAIGSDGGGESFGFNIESGEFFMIAFVSSGWADAIPEGKDFDEFFNWLGKDRLFERTQDV
jgi:hypothetical protein